MDAERLKAEISAEAECTQEAIDDNMPAHLVDYFKGRLDVLREVEQRLRE